jgi:hypothetical protein
MYSTCSNRYDQIIKQREEENEIVIQNILQINKNYILRENLYSGIIF